MLNKVLGFLGWLGTALVFGAVVIRFALPDRQEIWWWSAIAGLVLVLLYSLSQWREIGRVFSRRQARYGTLATSSVLVALGIVVALNWVLSRQNKRWDLTAGGQYSLSDQTRRVLEGLTEPITVRVFSRENEFPVFRDRLDEYTYVSPQVTVEYIDVDKQPLLAKQFEIQSYGTVVFEYQGRIERVVSREEQELTNGLIKVVEGEEQTVYFLQGHGEKDPNSTDARAGYSALRDALGRDNLTVSTLVLAQAGAIPDDATVLVVAGPQTDLLPGELDALRTYLTGAGKLLVMLDPPENADDPSLDGLVGLAADWGIEVGRNVVVDVSGVGQLLGTDASVPVAANYPAHAITDRFNLLTAYPLARSVKPIEGGTDGRIAEPFIETGQRSWAEADIAGLLSGQIELEEETGDLPGPVSIGVAVAVPAPAGAAETPPTDQPEPPAETDTEDTEEEAPRPESRLAVIGDSDFASNSAAGIQGNLDLALNTINWLAQQENLIAIRPREPEDRRLTLTQDQQIRISWLAILMIPGVILSLGVYAWWRRR